MLTSGAAKPAGTNANSLYKVKVVAMNLKIIAFSLWCFVALTLTLQWLYGRRLRQRQKKRLQEDADNLNKLAETEDNNS